MKQTKEKEIYRETARAKKQLNTPKKKKQTKSQERKASR